MNPMGRKPKRFPAKVDHHPKKPLVNWWEEENDDGQKKTERRKAKKEISLELVNLLGT